jgi:hypothetical protein
MTEALVERLGVWAVGWTQSIAMEEYEDRGPVPTWWTRLPPLTTPEETLDRIAAGLVAWHELLVELATDARGRFAGAGSPATDGAEGPPAWRVVNGRTRIGRSNFTFDRRLPFPWLLSWADADPAGREVDPATVAAVVGDLVARQAPPATEADWRFIDLWLDDLSVGLVERFGKWAVGWRWSIGEGDLDGGPVGAWCCFPHSAGSPEATAATISAAVVEWHQWLQEVAERFDRFLPLPADDGAGWERAVAHLVTAVGDRTQYESGWYGCCRTVLTWFLEAAGINRDRHPELLDHAVGGRFESWVEPSKAVVVTVAERLAGQVAG